MNGNDRAKNLHFDVRLVPAIHPGIAEGDDGKPTGDAGCWAFDLSGEAFSTAVVPQGGTKEVAKTDVRCSPPPTAASSKPFRRNGKV
jgi:hypothetical protein